MNTFAFVYSRTKRMDYRLVADLSDSICPFEIRTRFTKRIIGLTNVGDKDLESPQWLLIKEQGYLLWGVVCLNKLLGEEYGTDLYGIPLRGFAGVIITNYAGQPLPNDADFFSKVFKDVMANLYNSFTQSQVTNFTVDISSASSLIFPQSFSDKLNTDYHYCRLFSPIHNAESLVASCLSCPKDISIAFNVANPDSVTTPKFCPLRNAVMRYNLQNEEKDIHIKQLCSECGKEADVLQDGLCQSCWGEIYLSKPTKQRCSKCGEESEGLHDGLCVDCYKKEHERHKIFCPKCGRETFSLVKNKMCDNCYRRRKISVLFYIVMVLVVFVSWGVNRCVHKMSIPEKQQDKRKECQQADSVLNTPKRSSDFSRLHEYREGVLNGEIVNDKRRKNERIY